MSTSYRYTVTDDRWLEANVHEAPYRDNQQAGDIFINGQETVHLHPWDTFDTPAFHALTLGALGCTEPQMAATTGSKPEAIKYGKAKAHRLLGANNLPHAVSLAFENDIFRVHDTVRLPKMSERESEVLVCAAMGMEYAETATALGTSGATIRNQRLTLYNKIRVPNMAHAVFMAYASGMLAPDTELPKIARL